MQMMVQAWDRTCIFRVFWSPYSVSSGHDDSHDHSEYVLSTGQGTLHALSHLIKAQKQRSSRCGTKASNISISWDLVRKGLFLEPLQTNGSEALRVGPSYLWFHKPSGDADTCQNLRIPACVGPGGWCPWPRKDFNPIPHDLRVKVPTTMARNCTPASLFFCSMHHASLWDTERAWRLTIRGQPCASWIR